MRHTTKHRNNRMRLQKLAKTRRRLAKEAARKRKQAAAKTS
jgi:hypothetical protein